MTLVSQNLRKAALAACVLLVAAPAFAQERDNSPGLLDNLFSRGYITKSVRPFGDTLRYAICPVTEDPRRGGIAPDQFLAYTTRLDGSPLEPFLVANFESLRLTGEGVH